MYDQIEYLTLEDKLRAMQSKSERVDAIVDEAGSGIMTFFFTKANGDTRKLTGRKGVKAGVTGQGQHYDVEGAGNVIIFDMNAPAPAGAKNRKGQPRQRGNFRTVKKDRVFAITYNGTVYLLDTPPDNFEWPLKKYAEAKAATSFITNPF